MSRKSIYFILIILASFLLNSKEVNYDDFRKEGLSPIKKIADAPDFILRNMDNKSVSLKDYRGKVVVLNFWATWCPPCRAEMPDLENLHKKTKDLDIVVLAVDVGETRDTVEKFVKEENLTMEILLDIGSSVGRMYGANAIPATYIIDKEGKIIGGKIGAHDWDSDGVIKILKDLL